MIRLLLLGALALGPQSVAVPSPNPLADPRIQSIPYDQGQVVRLTVPLGFQATVVLDPAEAVESIAVGDSDSWEVVANQRGDHLFLRPLRTGGVTNLTVVTDVRIYAFEIDATSSPARDTPYIVRFNYPEPAPASAETGSLVTVGRYRISGAEEARPLAISDDGERTSIAWREDQPLAAVFALDSRSREVLVDGYMRDGLYVVDAVYPTLIFRSERRTARAHRLPAEAHR